MRQAAFTADMCDQLERLVAERGPITATAAGNPKINPALAELRLQRLLRGRMLVSLRIPLGDEDDSDREQYRGQRGFYTIQSEAS